MKTILIKTFFLLLLAFNCQAQKNFFNEVIRGNNVSYEKRTYEKSNVCFYTNINDGVIINDIKELGLNDSNALLELSKNKIIYNIIKEYIKPFEKSILKNKVLTLSTYFNSTGELKAIEFILPKDIDVNVNNLKIIEQRLKKELKVKVINMSNEKKFTNYAIVIRLNNIIDNSYPY